MDAPFAIAIGVLLVVALDLAALRFGCDSRRWVREMPGAGDGCGVRRPPLPRAHDPPVRPLARPLRLTGRGDAARATAPPRRGPLRLHPPTSATGYARLDLAALGK